MRWGRLGTSWRSPVHPGGGVPSSHTTVSEGRTVLRTGTPGPSDDASASDGVYVSDGHAVSTPAPLVAARDDASAGRPTFRELGGIDQQGKLTASDAS